MSGLDGLDGLDGYDGYDGYDAWRLASPPEHDTAASECRAPSCPQCGGCEARCDGCVACSCPECPRCEWLERDCHCGEYAAAGLVEAA